VAAGTRDSSCQRPHVLALASFLSLVSRLQEQQQRNQHAHLSSSLFLNHLRISPAVLCLVLFSLCRFLIPLGIALGAELTFGQFITQNLIPVTLGNIVGGLVFM
jgi:hypothetical protein